MSASLQPESLSTSILLEASAELGLVLPPRAAEQLLAFAELLRKWNRVHNLTAIATPQAVLTHHLLDCLAIVPEIAQAESPALRILDVGSGAGLPGLVLAAALPNAQITLVDRVQKKTAFMQQARIELGLGNVEVVHTRVEDLRAGPFPLIVSRALAELRDFVAMTAHLVARDGCWMAMKGGILDKEIAALPQTVDVARTVKLRVPLLDAERHLVVLRPR